MRKSFKEFLDEFDLREDRKELLLNCHSKSLKKVGQIYQLSIERIRQKETKIFRILRWQIKEGRRRICQEEANKFFDEITLEKLKKFDDFMEKIKSIESVEEFIRTMRESKEAGRLKNLRIKKVMEIPIDTVEISVRAWNMCEAVKIKTLGDLVQKTETEIFEYPNIGRKTLLELVNLLKKYDLHFGIKFSGLENEKKIEMEIPLEEELNYIRKGIANGLNISDKKLKPKKRYQADILGISVLDECKKDILYYFELREAQQEIAERRLEDESKNRI